MYVNEYHREHNADVIILLDTLMAAGHPHRGTTLDISVRAAASLASYYLRQKDRVGLVSYGGVCTWIQPSSGQLQWHRILDALLTARTHFSYHSKDITLFRLACCRQAPSSTCSPPCSTAASKRRCTTWWRAPFSW